MVKILRESNEIKQMSLECIKGATLLSTEEAEGLLTVKERKCTYNGATCWWWLRSPSRHQNYVAAVSCDGSVSCCGVSVDYGSGCVRPALILNLDSSNLQIGDIFEFGDNKFKIIASEYALCEEAIGQCTFRKDYKAKDANVYTMSDVKKFVDNWFKEIAGVYKGIKTDKMIADEYDFGF